MPEKQTTTDEKLDLIVKHLEHLDRRDRLRMIGGAVRSLITIIPTLLVLWSFWYFYQHSTELIKTITSEAAKQAAGYTQDQSSNFIKEMQNYIKK